MLSRDDHEFATHAIALYTAARKAAAQQQCAKRRGTLIGVDRAQALFESAVSSTADTYGESTPPDPYPLVYEVYTKECLNRIWEATLAKMSQIFESRLTQKGSLPQSTDTRRQMVRQVFEKRVYYAILHSLGGYFELNLVLNALCASAAARITSSFVVQRPSHTDAPPSPQLDTAPHETSTREVDVHPPPVMTKKAQVPEQLVLALF